MKKLFGLIILLMLTIELPIFSEDFKEIGKYKNEEVIITITRGATHDIINYIVVYRNYKQWNSVIFTIINSGWSDKFAKEFVRNVHMNFYGRWRYVVHTDVQTVFNLLMFDFFQKEIDNGSNILPKMKEFELQDIKEDNYAVYYYYEWLF